MQCCIGDSINVAMSVFNTLRPRQNGRHFPGDRFKRIFLNENVWISLKISLKFIPNGPINNISALVQIMAWRRPGDKSLSEAMVVNLLTHICVSPPHWVNPHNVKNRMKLVSIPLYTDYLPFVDFFCPFILQSFHYLFCICLSVFIGSTCAEGTRLFHCFLDAPVSNEPCLPANSMLFTVKWRGSSIVINITASYSNHMGRSLVWWIGRIYVIHTTLDVFPLGIVMITDSRIHLLGHQVARLLCSVEYGLFYRNVNYSDINVKYPRARMNNP